MQKTKQESRQKRKEKKGEKGHQMRREQSREGKRLKNDQTNEAERDVKLENYVTRKKNIWNERLTRDNQWHRKCRREEGRRGAGRKRTIK